MSNSYQLESLLRRLLAQTHEISIVLLDKDGLIIGWSGAAQICFGYEAPEVVGEWFGQLFTKSDIEQRIPEHELSVAASGTSAEDDRWLMRKDGGRIWVTGVTTALRSEDGELLGFAKVVRDRTDLKTKMDHDANRISALEKENERLVGATHDLAVRLKHPLALMTEALLLMDNINSEDQTGALLMLKECMADLQRTVGEPTGAHTADPHDWTQDFFPVELGALINDFAGGLKDAFSQWGVVIRVIVPKAVIVHRVNPVKINRLLGCLASNALRDMPNGGTIWLTLTVESSSVAIRLRDTGRGVAPEVLPMIFDLFSKKEGVVAVEDERGLPSVKRIADEHGGSIEIRSAGLGHGSEFTLRLPR